MEWGILFTVVGLHAIKFFGFAKEYLKNHEPRGPFQRPTRVRRQTLGEAGIHAQNIALAITGEMSMNDMTGNQLDRFIAALRESNEYNEAQKRGLIPEKVNWKKEGF